MLDKFKWCVGAALVALGLWMAILTVHYVKYVQFNKSDKIFELIDPVTFEKYTLHFYRMVPYKYDDGLVGYVPQFMLETDFQRELKKIKHFAKKRRYAWENMDPIEEQVTVEGHGQTGKFHPKYVEYARKHSIWG